MPTDRDREREQKKRKRKARKALLAFLKRLRKACETFETVDEWYEFLMELRSLLQAYEAELPADQRQRLEDAIRLADATREGIRRACEVLQFEIERAIAVLSVGGALGPVLIGGLIVGAIAVGITVVYLNLTAVPIVIRNHGCGPIPLREALAPGQRQLIGFLGVDLPELIPPDGEAIVMVPPVTVEVDATGHRAIALTILGRPVPLDISGELEGVTFNGRPLLGEFATVDLRERSQHELIVTCR